MPPTVRSSRGFLHLQNHRLDQGEELRAGRCAMSHASACILLNSKRMFVSAAWVSASDRK